MICVYKIYFEYNPYRVYIGSTVNSDKRKYKHFWELKNNSHHNEHLQRVYNKHLNEKLIFEAIEEIEDCLELITQETYWYYYYKDKEEYEVFNFNAPEIPPMYGKKLTKEHKRKISKGNKGKNHGGKGKKLSENTKRKISKAMKGENNPNYNKHPSEETRKKMSKSQKGKKLTEEHKRKISENHSRHTLGKYHSEDSKLKSAVTHGAKPFQVFDKNEQLIGEWVNQHQCAEELNLNNRAINSCLHNKRKTHKDYTFKYNQNKE